MQAYILCTCWTLVNSFLNLRKCPTHWPVSSTKFQLPPRSQVDHLARQKQQLLAQYTRAFLPHTIPQLSPCQSEQARCASWVSGGSLPGPSLLKRSPELGFRLLKSAPFYSEEEGAVPFDCLTILFLYSTEEKGKVHAGNVHGYRVATALALSGRQAEHRHQPQRNTGPSLFLRGIFDNQPKIRH